MEHVAIIVGGLLDICCRADTPRNVRPYFCNAKLGSKRSWSVTAAILMNKYRVSRCKPNYGQFLGFSASEAICRPRLDIIAKLVSGYRSER